MSLADARSIDKKSDRCTMATGSVSCSAAERLQLTQMWMLLACYSIRLSGEQVTTEKVHFEFLVLLGKFKIELWYRTPCARGHVV